VIRNPEKGVLASTYVFGTGWVDARRPVVSTVGLLYSFSPRVSKSDEHYAEVVESAVRASNAPLASGKSERGLDSAEWSPSGEPEARASGKSAAQRSEQRETSGGSGVFLAIHD
jgi:hypothetical protein